jgi:GT2 family glycosyltransferase
MSVSIVDSPSHGEHRREVVVVLICCYNGKQHLDGLLPSLLASNEPQFGFRVVVVDDQSTDDSGQHLGRKYPWVSCVTTERNSGFAGAANFGWQHISTYFAEVRYLVLLNQDTTVASGWLTTLKSFLDAHPRAAAVQPKILLFDKPDVINTVGNRAHYLGFGMMTGYGERDVGQYTEPVQCAVASGCAVMLRTDVLRELGLFDDRFYMYMEDVDLGWKLRQAGYEVWSIPATQVYHKYEPKAPVSHYENLERNRWIILLTYYRWRTLLALAPAIVLMELGQLLFAAMHGLVAKKLYAWSWFLRRGNLRHVLERRRRAASRRKLEDSELLDMHVATIHLPAGDPAILRWVGNPLLKLWWAIARHLVR